jgi:cell division protease FtsH
MITYFGLNKKVGNISYYDSSGQSEYSFTKPYSEKTAEIIDKEVSILVESAYQRAKNILLENKDKLEKLAHLLLEKEVIFREDLEGIFGKRPFPDQEHETYPEKAKEDEKEENKKTSGKEEKTKKAPEPAAEPDKSVNLADIKDEKPSAKQ